jgi:hypothetical protein
LAIIGREREEIVSSLIDLEFIPRTTDKKLMR